jgi:pimeloyl-ACP methyl ester carboxylesterase
VHLVGHSLGGVVIAQAIADGRLDGMVHKVITLGSPFGGSPWAGLLPFVEIVRALRPGSPLLRRLASAPVPDGVRWLAVTAALDIIVPGLRSVPTHAEVQTITFADVGHLGLLKQPGDRVRSRRAVRTRVGRRSRAVHASFAKRLLTNGHRGAGRGASACQMNCLQAANAVSRSTVSGLTKN